ncbi:copper chaperone PCu(A)C [Thauera sp. AutoDN2]
MRKPLTAALLLAASLSVSAQQLTVTEPWVRATVPQQKATGAFMHLRSDADVRLVAAESPVAGVVEIHEMSMQNDVMKMSPISGLDLPAGQDVELKPGGYHVMLMDLRQQVKVGDEVPLRLVIERRDGSRESVDVVAPARPLNARMQMKH